MRTEDNIQIEGIMAFIDRDNIDIWGVNYRLQPLQAIVAINRLKVLNSVIKIRNLNLHHQHLITMKYAKYLMVLLY